MRGEGSCLAVAVRVRGGGLACESFEAFLCENPCVCGRWYYSSTRRTDSRASCVAGHLCISYRVTGVPARVSAVSPEPAPGRRRAPEQARTV